MAEFLSPGVYVEEIPSAVQAIPGVGTTTAGFVGVVPARVYVPIGPVGVSGRCEETIRVLADGDQFVLKTRRVNPTPGSYTVEIVDENGHPVQPETVEPVNDEDLERACLRIVPEVKAGSTIRVGCQGWTAEVKDEVLAGVDGKRQRFPLRHLPIIPRNAAAVVTAEPAYAIESVTIGPGPEVEIKPAPAAGTVIRISYTRELVGEFAPEIGGRPRLCTSFSDFRKRFGDFSTDPSHRNLVHAVYGFFINGGTRCFITCVETEADLDRALVQIAAIDEVALVAAPGLVSPPAREKLVRHCALAGDRFAILDSKEVIDGDLTAANIEPPEPAACAAFYFPWIEVFDPVTRMLDPDGDGRVFVPPSGHVAGIYARVDTNRGVHKAPANEPVLGALGLRYQIREAQQDGLNPQGINCIRELNGAILLWGARTIGGDSNGDFRWINVRRSLLFLRESIDEGLQWAVFEPNDQNLWAKITRNVSAFLTVQWRAGVLFGATPQDAFYVKCDAETNPPELREIGQVVTEIGVAVVRPREFVIFRVSQWQPSKT